MQDYVDTSAVTVVEAVDAVMFLMQGNHLDLGGTISIIMQERMMDSCLPAVLDANPGGAPLAKPVPAPPAIGGKPDGAIGIPPPPPPLAP